MSVTAIFRKKKRKCTMARGTDLVGQRFGKLVVVEKTEERKDRYLLWRCRCDCGKECLANTKALRRGTIANCGCVPKTTARNGRVAENLAGQVFGELTVLSREESINGSTRWLCQCSCGRKKITTAHELKAGRAKCCGDKCHRFGRNITDITGRRFGRLTALYPTENRNKKSSVYWHCRCDCGNELEVTEDGLVSGSYKSCGCLLKEVQANIPNTLHRVDGTCVEHLEKRKYRNDNTSGFRGVVRLKNGGYMVNIGFKGKQYYVGRYRFFPDAVAARLEAEKIIHDGFLRAYYIWEKQAQEKPEGWADENPLIFEVEKVNGKFQIMTNMDIDSADV